MQRCISWDHFLECLLIISIGASFRWEVGRFRLPCARSLKWIAKYTCKLQYPLLDRERFGKLLLLFWVLVEIHSKFVTCCYDITKRYNTLLTAITFSLETVSRKKCFPRKVERKVSRRQVLRGRIFEDSNYIHVIIKPLYVVLDRKTSLIFHDLVIIHALTIQETLKISNSN